MITYQTTATDHLGPKPRPSVLPAAMLAFMGGLAPGPAPKPVRRCALPGCNNFGEKSYCCADHCREHQRLDRERRK